MSAHVAKSERVPVSAATTRNGRGLERCRSYFQFQATVLVISVRVAANTRDVLKRPPHCH